jgi:arsenate reductase (thioredoxin)
MAPLRILFVCTANSARSQMAEGFARVYGHGDIEAFSAGTDPKELTPLAVTVMREKGIDISQHTSKAWSEDDTRSMDYVITVCGNAAERCPILPPEVKRRHWPLEDPAVAEGPYEERLQVFRGSCHEIEWRVRALLRELKIATR